MAVLQVIPSAFKTNKYFQNILFNFWILCHSWETLVENHTPVRSIHDLGAPRSGQGGPRGAQIMNGPSMGCDYSIITRLASFLCMSIGRHKSLGRTAYLDSGLRPLERPRRSSGRPNHEWTSLGCDFLPFLTNAFLTQLPLCSSSAIPRVGQIGPLQKNVTEDCWQKVITESGVCFSNTGLTSELHILRVKCTTCVFVKILLFSSWDTR